MPSTRDIRRRIRSVKSTAQITKAMQMVASSKMRKAQDAAQSGRPYARLMIKVLDEVSRHAGEFTHPLMEKRLVAKRAVVLVSTDKGLCGALNGNLLREATKYDRQTTTFVVAGRKGAQFVARTRRQLAAEFTYRDTPSFAEARALSRFVRDLFLQHDVDAVDVLFTRFVSTLSQQPVSFTLLPVGELKIITNDPADKEKDDDLAKDAAEFLFEPSPDSVLGSLLPHYLSLLLFQVLLEAKASEHSARMVAMKNATDNAHQLVRQLTLEYNKLRQDNITKELLEISSAAMALE